MLTDLNWLQEGETFPPAGERVRMRTYSQNRQLFEAGHGEVYEEELKRIERVIGNFNQIISYPCVLNFQKLITMKTTDLLVGEPPKFKSENNQAELDAIVSESNLIEKCRAVAIDVSRYGDGLFTYRIGKGGKYIIDLTQPIIWYPIVDPENIKQFTGHVMAWTDGRGLNVRIYTSGQIERRTYACSDRGVIGRMTSTPEIEKTELDDFFILPVQNVTTSDRVFGLDDYNDIDSIVSELMVRIGQVSKILDKHAQPSMAGSPTALERDPVSGEWKVKSGTYFAVETGDVAPQYITWDGQLSANFTQIDRLVNLLYSISEMGSAIFGDMTNGAGQATSGEALKRLMISPLAKVNRIRMNFDSALKDVIINCGKLRNVDLSDVTIAWRDGLPSDSKEEADIMSIRTGGKPTMSQRRALQVYDGMTPEQAEEELGFIADEEEQANPMTPIMTQGLSTNLTPEEMDTTDEEEEDTEALEA